MGKKARKTAKTSASAASQDDNIVSAAGPSGTSSASFSANITEAVVRKASQKRRDRTNSAGSSASASSVSSKPADVVGSSLPLKQGSIQRGQRPKISAVKELAPVPSASSPSSPTSPATVRWKKRALSARSPVSSANDPDEDGVGDDEGDGGGRSGKRKKTRAQGQDNDWEGAEEKRLRGAAWNLALLLTVMLSLSVMYVGTISSGNTGNVRDARDSSSSVNLRLARQAQSLSSAPAAPSSDSTTTTSAARATTTSSTCVTGTQLGTFLFKSPNVSSIFVVGGTFNITFNLSTIVQRNRYPEQSIDLYLQEPQAAQTASSRNRPIVQNLPPTATYFEWVIGSISDGFYQIRAVADGKDPQYSQANNLLPLPCTPDGFPLPGVSGRFKIYNPVPIQGYPDPFPPNSGSVSLTNSRKSPLEMLTIISFVMSVVFLTF